MSTNSERKILEFQALKAANRVDVCESCGAPKQTTSFCRACAGRLVDIALSDVFEQCSEESGSGIGEDETSLGAKRRYYDHYEICESPDGGLLELGRGAMGITYKAEDMHLGCPVALKIINTSSLEGSAARTRLLREARAAARLRHSNIASIYHLGLDDQHCYYSMEYIAGETLEAFIRRSGAMSIEVAMDVVAQVAQALRVAHQHHFIHRDIKPSNIMLVSGERAPDGKMPVKLIDFGLVKAIADEQSAQDHASREYFVGTPIYASPEQLDFGTVDVRSDIYSLGMCLWYMLSGRHPETSAEPQKPQRRLPGSTSVLSLPAGRFPTPVTVLLRAMTAWDADLRPGTAVDLIRRIQSCQRGLYHRGTDPEPVYQHHRFSSVGFKVLGLFALLCLVASALFLRSIDQSKKDVLNRSARLEASVLCAQGDEYRQKYTSADNRHSIDLYTRAIERFPGLPAAHAGLALAYFQNVARYGAPAQTLDLAVESAQKAVLIDANFSEGYAALGVIRSQQGRQWEALTQLHRALELNPKDVLAMRYFSSLWEFVGKPHLGLPWAQHVVQTEPTNTGGWITAASSSVDLCADEQAARFYQKCLEVNPSMMQAYCGLLHLDLLHADFPRARRDYAMAESIEPGLIHPLTLKAQIELFSGDYVAAEVTYRRLLEMNRTGLVSYFSGISYLSALGFLRSRAGDLTEANALLNEASQANSARKTSEGPQAVYDLAAIRAVQGHTEDALALLRRAIAAGWIDFRATRLDPRFGSLWKDAKFVHMLSDLEIAVANMRAASEQLCAKSLHIEDYPVQTSSR